MKGLSRILLILLGFSLVSAVHAQNYSGQWKGSFDESTVSLFSSNEDRSEYVLELDIKGTEISGYSYTYFYIDGKKYFTICKVKGSVNKAIKFLEVTEFERVKTNVPAYIQNCFQSHRLNYSKNGDLEILKGSWRTAPGQVNNCGNGITQLTRRSMKSLYPGFNAKPSIPASAKKPTTQQRPSPSAPMASKPAVKPKPTTPAKPGSNDVASHTPQVPQTVAPTKPSINRLEERPTNLLSTYTANNSSIQISIYDNGQVDGDSISLYFNGKLLVENHLLTEKPLNITLTLQKGNNDLVMYAESLGTIPPNSALLIIRDGNRKMEVPMSSDLKKSGTLRIRFED